MVPSGEAGEDGDEDEETDLTSMSSSSSSLSVDLATLGLGNEGEEDLSDSSDSYRPGFSLPDQETVADEWHKPGWGKSTSVAPVSSLPAMSLLNINIETLMGTSYDVKVSPGTTVGFLKLKLQRCEGIPKDHLHLIHRGSELDDQRSLHQCGVVNGSTLKLVLSMRGGPINTRRVLVPQSDGRANPLLSPKRTGTCSNLEDIMQINKDKIMERIPKHQGQMTLLLLREGDKVNLYQVMEKPDRSSSAKSTTNSGEIGKGESLNLLQRRGSNDARLRDNVRTMKKMSHLKKQMQDLSVNRNKRKIQRNAKPKEVRLPESAKGKTKGAKPKAKESSNFEVPRRYSTFSSTVPLPPISKGSDQSSSYNDPDEIDNTYIEGQCSITSLELSRKSTNSKGISDWNKGSDLGKCSKMLSSSSYKINGQSGEKYHKSHEMDLFDLKVGGHHSNRIEIVGHRKTQKLISTDVNTLISESSEPVKGQRRLSLRSKQSASPQYSNRQSQSSHKASKSSETFLRPSNTSKSLQGHPSQLRKAEVVRYQGGMEKSDEEREIGPLIASQRSSIEASVDSTLDYPILLTRRNSRVSIGSTSSVLAPRSSQKTERSLNEARSSRPMYVANRTTGSASSVAKARPKSKAKPFGSDKKRCSDCRKRLNITNSFPCRCEGIFCAKHRHPEFHKCPIDYKALGRECLLKANPTLTIPKLPKI